MKKNFILPAIIVCCAFAFSSTKCFAQDRPNCNLHKCAVAVSKTGQQPKDSQKKLDNKNGKRQNAGKIIRSKNESKAEKSSGMKNLFTNVKKRKQSKSHVNLSSPSKLSPELFKQGIASSHAKK